MPIGIISDFLGLSNSSGEERAAEAAAAASREATKLGRENLEWNKEQYALWDGIYGDIERNLGEFYKNLNGEQLLTMGLQEQQKEFQRTQKQVSKDLAKRGLGDSKFEGYVQANLTGANNHARADLRANSENRANEQKMNFLQIGLGQKGAALQNVNTAAGSAINAHGAAASIHNSQFQTYANNNQSGKELVASNLISFGGEKYNPGSKMRPMKGRK